MQRGSDSTSPSSPEHQLFSQALKWMPSGDPGSVSETSVDVYAVASGERISHDADTATVPSSEAAIGRLALRTYSALATREGLNPAGQRAVLAATTSPAAAGHLIRGQARFRQWDLDGATTELHAAIQADSACGLAYQRRMSATSIPSRTSFPGRPWPSGRKKS